jgi:hypothetical protein
MAENYVIFLTTLHDIKSSSDDDHTHIIMTKSCVEHELLLLLFFELFNLPPQTFMSWNGFALDHYIGCVALACPNMLGLLGTLFNIMGKGKTIP